MDKTQCYKLVHDVIPDYIAYKGWAWIQRGKVFKFLGMDFTFQGSPKPL